MKSTHILNIILHFDCVDIALTLMCIIITIIGTVLFFSCRIFIHSSVILIYRIVIIIYLLTGFFNLRASVGNQKCCIL